MAAVFARGERLIGIGDVDEVMRKTRAFFLRLAWLCPGPCRDRRRPSRN